MKISAKEKIVQIFTGFRPLKKRIDISGFTNISTNNFDPPSYIVRKILIDLLKFYDYGRWDTASWHTLFKYKDNLFLIYENKLDTWTLQSICNDETGNGLAMEIKKKIKAAGSILDKALHEYFKYDKEHMNFHLMNLNSRLAPIYYFYFEKTKEAIEDVRKNESTNKAFGSKISISGLVTTTVKLQRCVFYFACSMINAFYSYSEFLLDVIYAFEQPEVDFWEFRKMCWEDRLKILLNVKHKDLNEIYKKMVSYRKQYRNPLSHGLTNEISILVNLDKNSGLIPLSYQHLSNELYYGVPGIIEINVVEDIVNTCSLFLDYLNKTEPYCYYLNYAESGLDIPVNPENIQEIKNEMTSKEDFEEYLTDELNRIDAINQ